MTALWRADFAATPPFHHLGELARELASDDWPSLARLNALAEARELRNAAGRPLRFVAQAARCGQRDYEAGILIEGAVPTREGNWHDLLNALTWLAFPRAKAALNAVQCAALEQRVGSERGARSDAATLFDESGLVLVAPRPARAGEEGIAALLAARLWREAFVERRGEWRELRVYGFGHALLEKLLAPWPGVTAKCLLLEVAVLPAPGMPPDSLDAALADACQDARMACPGDLFPLPVLGLPGWWPGNEAPTFYDDATVFRPLRAV